jgi:hypothetical protein
MARLRKSQQSCAEAVLPERPICRALFGVNCWHRYLRRKISAAPVCRVQSRRRRVQVQRLLGYIQDPLAYSLWALSSGSTLDFIIAIHPIADIRQAPSGEEGNPRLPGGVFMTRAMPTSVQHNRYATCPVACFSLASWPYKASRSK